MRLRQIGYVAFEGSIRSRSARGRLARRPNRNLQFDLRATQGMLIVSLMAALAEFERDLLRERVRSGIAAARKRGVVSGRRPAQRVKADRFGLQGLGRLAESVRACSRKRVPHWEALSSGFAPTVKCRK
jgi:DNA invertase Pin-like site-specific DNA recombinase